jgi:hypothetical protein
VVPRSADGTEGWLAAQEPESVVPRSADGYEGWLRSLTEG